MKHEYSAPSCSRRKFMQGSIAVFLSKSAPGLARKTAAILKRGKAFAYIGTYTRAVDGGANGRGIYSCEVDAGTGKLSLPKLVAETQNPSWIAIHPSKRYLYAINEIADYHGTNGSVSAFSIDHANGNLTPINTVSSEGAGPAHMSLDASSKFAFVANYIGGSVAVLPILGGGALSPAVDVHRDLGSIGAVHATDAPTGSFAISGHDAPHAHMIAADPKNRFVLATDLGQDRIYVYQFDSATGKLTPSSGTPIVSLPSGDGPRHFAFHPNGRWLYALQEESSTIAFFHYDSLRGSLAAQQTISVLPLGFAGSSFASEILIAPNGRCLYAVNRLHDTISICSIDTSGALHLIGEASTMGDYPRHCGIDATRKFLYSCNQRSDCVTGFRIEQDTGLLKFTGQYTPVGSPAMIAFLT
jgi:6-phosphogluconolactonase